MAFVPRFASAAEGEVALALTGQGGGALDRAAGLAAGGLDVWVGVDDWLWVSSGLSAGNAADESFEGSAWAGAGVMLDVLAWIPWVETHAGLRWTEASGAVPAVRFGLGMDRLLSPHWFVGAVVRWEVTAQRRAVLSGGSRILGGLRLGVRWEP